MSTPTTAAALAASTHSFRTIAGTYGAAYCTRCGLGSYQADGLVCRGTRSHACPTQSNAFVHGTCAQQFDTYHEAHAHWQEAHLPLS